jgi:hypothetical protein
MHRALIAIAIAIVGCQETQHCDPGRSYREGECRPFDAAFGDMAIASPCGTCGAATPVCVMPDGGAPTCVQCVTNVDCHQTATGGDAGFFVCSANHCVAGCNQDSDCASSHCTMMHRCSMYGRHQTTCQPCDADEDCSQIDGPASCVVTRFQNTDDGGHCLSRPNPACVPPYAMTIARPSVDGATGMSCVFDETTTTCAAVLSTIAGTHCTMPSDCAMRGAICDVVRTGMPTQCTYDCTHTADCPTNFGCAGQTFCHM